MKRKILTLISSFIVSSAIYAQDLDVQNGWQLLGAIEDINISNFDNTCVDYLWKYKNEDWQVYIANNQTYDLSNITAMTSLNQGDGFWIKGITECKISTETQTPKLLKYIIDFGDISVGIDDSNTFNLSLPKNTDIIDLILFNTFKLNIKDLNITNGIIDFRISMKNNDGDTLKLSIPDYEKDNNNISLNFGSNIVIALPNGMEFWSMSPQSISDDNNTLMFTPKYFLDYIDSDSYYAKFVKSTFGFFFPSDSNGYDILIQVNDVNFTGYVNITD